MKKAECKIVWDTQGVKTERKLKLRVTWNRDHRYYSIPDHPKVTYDDFVKGSKKHVKEAKSIGDKAKVCAENICRELGINFTFTEFKIKYDLNVFQKKISIPLEKSITLKNLLSTYIVDKGLRPNTTISYKSAVQHILNYRDNVQITELTPSLIDAAFEKLKKSHKKKTGHELSVNTLGIYIRSLKAICKYAVDKNLLLCNPLKGMKVIKAPRQKRALTEDEWNKFNSFVPKENSDEEFAHDFGQLIFALSGANMVDILRIKNENIDGNVIKISRQKTEKAGTQLVLPYVDFTKEVFQKYGCINEKRPDDYILPFYKGTLTEEQRNFRRDNVLWRINKGIKSICNQIGMQAFTTYNIRHTFASFGTQLAGLDVSAMRQLLGHKYITTTQIYLDTITTTSLEKACELINSKVPSHPC